MLSEDAVPEECDILQLAYGGLGGHRAVVEEMSQALAVTALKSSALLLAREGEFAWGRGTPGIAFLQQVPIRHRADFGSMFQVMNSVRRLKPTFVVAHTHRHIPAVWLGLLLAGRRPAVLMVEHQSVRLRRLSDNVRSLIGLLFSKGVVFLTPSYRDEYPLRSVVKMLNRYCWVVPNGISVPKEFKKWPVDGACSQVIGMASRLIPSKRVDLLIEALSILNQGGNWTLRIAGEGHDRRRLESLVRDRCLEDQVIFDGNVDRSHMANWYLSLDCYVQVSEGETMSMSVVEAASFGLPIVSSKDPGIEQIFDANRSIVLLERNTPEVVAAEIQRIFQNRIYESLGAEARACVENKFGAREMARRYLNALIEIDGGVSSRIKRALVKLRESR